MRILLLYLATCLAFESVYGTAADKIVSYAKSKIGDLSYVSDTVDRSVMFVDMGIMQGGLQWPGHQFLLGMTMLTAKEWSDPNHKHATYCYSRCTGSPVPGDILAENGHVTFVTGNQKTTAPSMEAAPRGKVEETDWGFRDGQNPVCWRYSSEKTCTPHDFTGGK